jgi:thiamine phosphate synthase YjbQ (UPF0047 family)
MHVLLMAVLQVGLASIFILHTSAGLTINENGKSRTDLRKHACGAMPSLALSHHDPLPMQQVLMCH